MFGVKKSMPPQFPTRQWLLQKREDTVFTPDVVSLERQKAVNLFVCCELMRNMPQAELVYTGGVYQCPAYTSLNFSTFKRTLGKASQQIPLTPDYRLTRPDWADQRPAAPAKIKGELWTMLPQHIFGLDRYKKNTVQFIRVRVNVDIPYRHVRLLKDPHSFADRMNIEKVQTKILTAQKMFSVRAYMYVGIPEYWEDQIDGGYNFQAVRVYNSRHHEIGEYSYFSPMELNDFFVSSR